MPDVSKMSAAQLASEVRELRCRTDAQAAEHAVGSRLLEQYKAALDAHSIVVTTNRHGLITYANDKFCEISKFERDELIGQDHCIINSRHHPKEFFRNLWGTIGCGKTWKGEICNRAKDGAIYWVDTTIFPFLDAHGKPEQYLAIRTDITQRKQEEQERAQLEKQILEISDRERRRIGQDLHDGLGQHLCGSELMIQALARKLEVRSQEDAAQATRISEHLREAIRQTKSLARGLSPVDLQANGLTSALQELALNIREIFRTNVTFEARTAVLLEDNARATHLFRIAQEALSNAVKHGAASNIRIQIEQTATDVILSVIDDGRGFSPTQANTGMGLRIMQYRAAMIGGRITVQSTLSQGTKVICIAPISR